MVAVQLFMRQCVAAARLEANKCKRKPFLSQDVCVMGYLIYTGNNNASILGGLFCFGLYFTESCESWFGN